MWEFLQAQENGKYQATLSQSFEGTVLEQALQAVLIYNIEIILNL
jgi:hypothetical protein